MILRNTQIYVYISFFVDLYNVSVEDFRAAYEFPLVSSDGKLLPPCWRRSRWCIGFESINIPQFRESFRGVSHPWCVFVCTHAEVMADHMVSRAAVARPYSSRTAATVVPFWKVFRDAAHSCSITMAAMFPISPNPWASWWFHANSWLRGISWGPQPRTVSEKKRVSGATEGQTGYRVSGTNLYASLDAPFWRWTVSFCLIYAISSYTRILYCLHSPYDQQSRNFSSSLSRVI